MTSTLPLLDSFSALADPTRCRMLFLLEGHELMVSELCVVLQLPQSTVSRHLKMLADAGFVASRREGTSRFYSLALEGPQATSLKSHAELWQLARREFVDRPAVAQDARRLERVLADRSAASREFFANSAAEWDRLRDELFGDQFYWRALLGLLPSNWIVGDFGCGTGAIAAALAAHVGRVIGVDASMEMLEAAARRLASCANVDLRRGSLEALPIEDDTLDAATFVLVLHHLPAPALALAEARRVLRPGGRLLIVDMTPHEHEEYRQRMGHVWLGFSEEQTRRLFDQTGFTDVRYHAVPAVTEAKGPALFAASAAKSGNSKVKT
jgi:ubiquinone/menaquinone biosynthesis C-methylase UbiE/DNA-binding transcriptional ArsR family regulator